MNAVFTENWFGVSSREALARLAGAIEAPGRIVEIGSWEGRSTIALANATDRTVHAVDTWQGCGTDETGELAAQRDVHARWRRNIDVATGGNVVEHRMDWREYAASDDSPVALLFLDAEHTYDEVHAQISAFLPMMSPGGVMCGDDASHPPVWQAVTDLLDDVHLDAALWVWWVPA